MSTNVADLILVYSFIKRLTTPFDETEAFKHGIIDERGKRIKSKEVKTTAEQKSYGYFDRLVFNVKKLLEKLPGGKNRLASYAAALFLIKEHCGITGNKLDKEVFKYLKESGLLEEGLMEEFIHINKIQNERTYTLVRSLIIDEDVNAERGDTIIHSGAKPAGKVYGVSVFKMYNIDKESMMYCTGHDLR